VCTINGPRLVRSVVLLSCPALPSLGFSEAMAGVDAVDVTTHVFVNTRL
jgi:hypothetical protein